MIPAASSNRLYREQPSSPAVSLCSDCGISSSDEENVSFPNTKRTVIAARNRPLKITDLPPELMETIFRYLPFETVAKVRLVCQHFNTIGSSVLNSEFQHLRVSMQQRFQSIKSQMPRRESARRKHPLARESDIIEILHMRLTLLHMTFAKHIEKKHCCFFAGEILDEVYRILRYVKTTPILNKAYKVTDELFDLSTMAMEYFKEHIEPALPEITYFGTECFEPSCSYSRKLQLPLLDEPSTSSSSYTSKPPSVVERPAISPAVNKRLRKLRESLKRNNGQVNALKQELKVTKRKVFMQQKQINELKSRFEDYDKKFLSASRKLNAVLQELNHCKTELQYWRSKSPAAQCSCGKVTPIMEIKDPDNVSVQAPLNDVPFQSEGDSKGAGEFKPILLEAGTASTSRYFVVIPDCRNTQSVSSIPTSSVAAPNPSKVTTLAKSSSDVDAHSSDMLPKGCKRKLEWDDDKLFYKFSKD